MAEVIADRVHDWIKDFMSRHQVVFSSPSGRFVGGEALLNLIGRIEEWSNRIVLEILKRSEASTDWSWERQTIEALGYEVAIDDLGETASLRLGGLTTQNILKWICQSFETFTRTVVRTSC